MRKKKKKMADLLFLEIQPFFFSFAVPFVCSLIGYKAIPTIRWTHIFQKKLLNYN